MSIFFTSANTNHALILETFGLPTLASKEKLFMPAPCCQNAKSFKVCNADLTIRTPDFALADGVSIYVVCSASYSIDTTSRSNIMKAYKSLHHPKAEYPFRDPFKENKTVEADAEDDIKEIISKLIARKAKGMSYGEVTTIDLSFVDSLYQEAKEVLADVKVDLTDFKITEIVKYGGTIKIGQQHPGINEEQVQVEEEVPVCSENIGELESGVEGEFKDLADGSADLVIDADVEKFEYVISIIPEATTSTVVFKTTTSEIIMDAPPRGSETVTTENPSEHELDAGVGDDSTQLHIDVDSGLRFEGHVDVNVDESTETHMATIDVGHGDSDVHPEGHIGLSLDGSAEIPKTTINVGPGDSDVHSDDHIDDNVDDSMEALMAAIGNFQAPATVEVEHDDPEVHAKPDIKIQVGHGDPDIDSEGHIGFNLNGSTEAHTTTIEVGHGDSDVHSEGHMSTIEVGHVESDVHPDDDIDENADDSMEALMAAIGNFEAPATVEVEHDDHDVHSKPDIKSEVGHGDLDVHSEGQVGIEIGGGDSDVHVGVNVGVSLF